jgi:hypothetical protein
MPFGIIQSTGRARAVVQARALDGLAVATANTLMDAAGVG